MHFLQFSSTKLADFWNMNSFLCHLSPCKILQTGVFGVKLLVQGRGGLVGQKLLENICFVWFKTLYRGKMLCDDGLNVKIELQNSGFWIVKTSVIESHFIADTSMYTCTSWNEEIKRLLLAYWFITKQKTFQKNIIHIFSSQIWMSIERKKTNFNHWEQSDCWFWKESMEN